MIRTVAEFLTEFIDAHLPILDESPVKHAPTIGAMYEGLATEILDLAIPPDLDLRIVTGFVTDGAGHRSSQMDCMVVSGQGERIPFTELFEYHVENVIAVIEVKKMLLGAEIAQAHSQTNSIRQIEAAYINAHQSGSRHLANIAAAYRTFGQITGQLVRDHDDALRLAPNDQILFHHIVREHTSIARIIFGLHGSANEAGLRRAISRLLVSGSGVRNQGFGAAGLPHLIISGRYSIVKSNGLPYWAPLRNGKLLLYSSSSANPLILLLECVWTRICQIFDMSSLWGDDLEVEVFHPLVHAEPIGNGWSYGVLEIKDKDLRMSESKADWNPIFLSEEQFQMFLLLSEGPIAVGDTDITAMFPSMVLSPEEFRNSLIQTGLVAIRDNTVDWITVDCVVAVTPDGRCVAADNNTGRLSRWLERNL